VVLSADGDDGEHWLEGQRHYWRRARHFCHDTVLTLSPSDDLGPRVATERPGQTSESASDPVLVVAAAAVVPFRRLDDDWRAAQVIAIVAVAAVGGSTCWARGRYYGS